ncbi:amidohydrolase family protein [Facilibium subflavum]|uniref:amidohydrolase family protein n=1 Tax=Facilibium subflavum TaxID=2219058 RepID=UPI001F335083|nr:amidohydrolase family protein [Facilibium subflavum]
MMILCFLTIYTKYLLMRNTNHKKEHNGMEIIDAHIHFWDLSQQMNQWVLNADKRLQKNFTPEQLPKRTFVHIEAHDSSIDTLHEVNWLTQAFPDTSMRYISCIDFFQSFPQYKAQIDRLRAYDHVVGVRQILAYHPKAAYSPMKSNQLPEDFKQKLAYLAQHNMVFECQMYPQQIINCLGDIEKSAVTTAIEHFGLPLCASDKDMQYWKAMVDAIANKTNIFVKLSGFFMLNQSKKDMQYCLKYLLDRIPSNRLCYGSNYPVCHTENYDYWFELLKTVIPDNTYADIFANTARNLYWR